MNLLATVVHQARHTSSSQEYEFVPQAAQQIIDLYTSLLKRSDDFKSWIHVLQNVHEDDQRWHEDVSAEIEMLQSHLQDAEESIKEKEAVARWLDQEKLLVQRRLEEKEVELNAQINKVQQLQEENARLVEQRDNLVNTVANLSKRTIDQENNSPIDKRRAKSKTRKEEDDATSKIVGSRRRGKVETDTLPQRTPLKHRLRSHQKK